MEQASQNYKKNKLYQYANDKPDNKYNASDLKMLKMFFLKTLDKEN